MVKLDKYFDKIYVINLFDKTERWEKVRKQFANRRIKIERFIAIDGRCSTQGREGCLAKLKTFEMIYNVEIPYDKHTPLVEIVPAASLTIGTILILRDMVKNKYERILICEDDINLTRDFQRKFTEGITELKKARKEKAWDLLYLGCGNQCGSKGLSWEKTARNKIISPTTEFTEEEFYVQNTDDLRYPCEEDICPGVTRLISKAYTPKGTWCYSYSLKGARKTLRYIGNDAAEHIDQLIANASSEGKMIAYAFNPPIVMHESIRGGRASDIPWEW